MGFLSLASQQDRWSADWLLNTKAGAVPTFRRGADWRDTPPPHSVSPRTLEPSPPQVRGSAHARSVIHSGAVCAGSNPAGGTQHEVPKDPVTSGNAEAGVFAFVPAYAVVCSAERP